MLLLNPNLYEFIFCPIGFCYGAVTGSFLNVCIYRLPRDETVIAPPSHCPYCRTKLRWKDLVPLFSQIRLRGRCRYCGQRFAWRYFGVELLTGLSFAAVVATSQDPLRTLQGLILVSCLIATFFIDLDHYIIPDEVNWTLALGGIMPNLLQLMGGAKGGVLLPVHPLHPELAYVIVPSSLLGAAVGGGVLALIRGLGTVVFRKEAMGWGDVKLAAAFGANILAPRSYFGAAQATDGSLWDLLTFYLLSFIIGAAISVALIAFRRRKRSDYIPFGPMLAIGAYLTWFLGPSILTPFAKSLYYPFG